MYFDLNYIFMWYYEDLWNYKMWQLYRIFDDALGLSVTGIEVISTYLNKSGLFLYYKTVNLFKLYFYMKLQSLVEIRDVQIFSNLWGKIINNDNTRNSRTWTSDNTTSVLTNAFRQWLARALKPSARWALDFNAPR